jgi:competence protein ComEC
MRENIKKYGLFFFVVLLLVLSFLILTKSFDNKDELTFSMLDIGQGDALFIKSPTGVQVLVDAGPQSRVMSRLPQVMPFFDRTIDAVIVTNPDSDHISGFLDVLKVYKVGKVFEPGTFNESKTYRDLEELIKRENIPNFLAKKGTVIDIGGGAYIQILFPDRDVFDWSTNDGSIVAKLVYGETEIMLTGDTTEKVESILLKEYPKEVLDSDFLKVAHHGSKYSSSLPFVLAVSPEYSLISSGKENKYGHPHTETIENLEKSGSNILRTDELGTITFRCDRIGVCKINK